MVTDVANVRQSLHAFGLAMGLITNIQKSEMFQIRCADTDNGLGVAVAFGEDAVR
ncbi:hypothetical protein C2845_PM06G04670 [Panicum miliaceum]|uniref:Uncharacterized protein n=1 Tax=Panicum miliaceum TaxID=4540 RepID=A0A3L6R8M2_PANMI|nr:hypothetical protein C2845_PM06G04670 [Panicum miliaceum]